MEVIHFKNVMIVIDFSFWCRTPIVGSSRVNYNTWAEGPQVKIWSAYKGLVKKSQIGRALVGGVGPSIH